MQTDHWSLPNSEISATSEDTRDVNPYLVFTCRMRKSLLIIFILRFDTLSNWMYLKLCQCFSGLFQSSFQTSDMPLKLTTVHILHLTKVFKDTWLSSPTDQFTFYILANRLLLCYFVLLLIAAIREPASEKNPYANRDNSRTRSHLQSQTDYTSRGFAN